MLDTIVETAAGIALGFGLSAALFMRVVVRKLQSIFGAQEAAAAKLQAFNEATAKKLEEYHASGVQKVEEQNMHAVLKRINDLERARGK